MRKALNEKGLLMRPLITAKDISKDFVLGEVTIQALKKTYLFI